VLLKKKAACPILLLKGEGKGKGGAGNVFCFNLKEWTMYVTYNETHWMV